MTKRLIFCEGPDDMAALRAVAQLLGWAAPAPAAAPSGAGQSRVMTLLAGSTVIEVGVPSRARGATGEGKSTLAATLADNLAALRSQPNAADESAVSLLAAVFDPDDDPPGRFCAEVERTMRERAVAWALAETDAPGVWCARRGTSEQVEIRAVHWRAPGEVLGGLLDHANLERLLCAVLAKAYPEDNDHVARWLREIAERQRAAGRKLAGWKAAIHVWSAVVYEKADENSAAARFLHQHKACRPHVEPTLQETGLLDDLRPLIAP